MSERIFPDFLPTSTQSAAASPRPPGQSDDVTFHDVLSALNPLQYLPVAGNIYRALTGDVIPEPLRFAGSMVVSALMGGPVGVLVNAASTAFQRISGIDFDRIAHDVFAAIGIIGDDAPTTALAHAAPAPSSAARTDNAAEPTAPVYDAALRRAATSAYARTNNLA